MTFDNMVLYTRSFCPFCVKVKHFLDKNGIDIEQRNAGEPEHRDALLAIGGKTQVPCLVVDGKAMYESDDIIAYLKSFL